MKTTRLIPVLLALATSAFAQETPARLALAHDVVIAMRADHMFDGMIAQTQQASRELTALPPNPTPDQYKQAQELNGQIMDLAVKGTQGLTSQMDQVFASTYTDAELNAMKTFFTSPEGQSMMAKQAQIMAKIRPQFQAMQHDLGLKVQQLVEASKSGNAAKVPMPTAAPGTAPMPTPTPAPGK